MTHITAALKLPAASFPLHHCKGSLSENLRVMGVWGDKINRLYEDTRLPFPVCTEAKNSGVLRKGKCEVPEQFHVNS